MHAAKIFVFGCLAVAVTATAQEFPDKARVMKIIAPGAPGGAVDVLARALARSMNDTAGVNVIVENKTGAEMVIGMQALKIAAPDGYTMALTTTSTQVLNRFMVKNLSYDPTTDFIAVAGISRASLILSAGPSLPFKTAREFVDAARAQPGKYSVGSGTATTRLAGEMLQQHARISLLGVPFKSIADTANALAAGQVDIVLADPLSLGPHHQSGRARPLAVTSATRISALPQVPTLVEEGVEGYALSAWFGTHVPARTPAPVVARLEGLVRQAAATPQFKATLQTFAMEPLDVGSEALATIQRNDTETFGRVLRGANIETR